MPKTTWPHISDENYVRETAEMFLEFFGYRAASVASRMARKFAGETPLRDFYERVEIVIAEELAVLPKAS